MCADKVANPDEPFLVALQIIRGDDNFPWVDQSLGANIRRRWAITFIFGLVHGFGFSFALRETLQFAGAHLLTSLFSFNIGVELGQLFVLAITVPILALLFRKVLPEVGGAMGKAIREFRQSVSGKTTDTEESQLEAKKMEKS